MKQWPAIIAVVLLTAAAVVFTGANLAPVEVDLGPWSVAQPLFATLLVSLLIGFLLGVFVAWLAGRGRRRQARALASRNAQLLRQIDDLRRAQSSPARLIEAGPPGRAQRGADG